MDFLQRDLLGAWPNSGTVDKYNMETGMKALALFYAFANYAVGVLVVVYGIPWLANLGSLGTIDSNPPVSLDKALLVNTGLLLLFGIQHTIQARPWWKKIFNNVVHPAVERATYMFGTNIVFILLYLYWQPVEGNIWKIENEIGVIVMWVLCGLGWVIAFTAIIIKNHFHFLGLRQAWLFFRNKEIANEQLKESFIYSLVRHPMYFGFLVAFWATPDMTIGHFIFSFGMTIYTFVGIQFEERLLRHYIGETYEDYQKKVPMLVPFTKLGTRK